MRVALRPFLTSDLPTLDAWVATGEPGLHMSRWKPQSEDSGPDRLRWWMIVADGRDVGTLWLEKENAVEDMATLGILIGDVAWRGNGIGRQAIRLALDEVRDVWRHHRIRLRVRASNGRAIRCYTALDFRETGTSVKTLGDGTKVDVLEMALQSGT